MYSVKILQHIPTAGMHTVYEQTFDNVEHYDDDIWLARKDGRDIFIRPAHNQLLIVEELAK